MNMQTNLDAPSPTVHPEAITHKLDITDSAIQQKAHAAGALRLVWTEAAELRAKLREAAIDTPVQQARRLDDFIQKRLPEALKRVDAEREAQRTLVTAIDDAIMTPLRNAGERGLFAAEIRARLSQMGEVARSELLATKLKAKELPTLGAILAAPAFLSGLSEGAHALLLSQYKHAVNPDGVRRAAQITTAQDRLDAAGTLTYKAVLGMVDRPALKRAEAAERELRALASK